MLVIYRERKKDNYQLLPFFCSITNCESKTFYSATNTYTHIEGEGYIYIYMYVRGRRRPREQNEYIYISLSYPPPSFLSLSTSTSLNSESSLFFIINLFTDFKAVQTADSMIFESIESSKMNMGRGAYDTTGTPAPRPPPKGSTS